MVYPKLELHVHFEATVGPALLLALAKQNDVALPVDSVEELTELYRFSDFDNFIETWLLVTSALRTADDFRRVVVDYAGEAVRQGALYIEGIFSPAQVVRRGVSWDEVFSGYCDGAQEARETYGVEVRLTPDITRSFPLDVAEETARYSVAYRDRGVVGLGLGGYEAEFPPEPFEAIFNFARENGLGSVPHAGEVAGPPSIWGALDRLHADRIRHGIRSVEDPALLKELRDRGTVLDICPISNIRVGIINSFEEHPLPALVGAGVRCSISTDDPAMFDTDLTRECDTAWALGLHPQAAFESAVAGALCDGATRERLRATGEAFDWSSLGAAPAAVAAY